MQTITKCRGLLAKLKLLAILFAFLLINEQSWGQTIVSYTGMGSITCPATPTATISPAVTGLTFSQISRGSGVTCASASTAISGSGFNVSLASAISNNKWYKFNITSDASVTFTLSSLSIVSQVSSAVGSPNVSVQYSINEEAKTVIGSYTPTTSSATYTITPTSPISVGANQVLSIYIIPNSLTAAGTTCRITNASSVTVTTTTSGLLTPPALVADIIDNNVDNNVDITFLNDAAWLAAVSAVKVGSTALTPLTDYELTAGNLKLKPSGLNPILTSSGVKNVVIEAAGYSITSVSQIINAGFETKLGIKTQPVAPISNGNVLATQPAIYIQDQYGNTTTSNASVTASVASGTWTIGGSTLINANAGTATFSGLTATSGSEVVNASIIFSSGSLVSVTSSMFAIPAPGPELTVSSTSLTGFNYFVGSGPSAEQSFTISAINLINDISITAPSHYEVSLVSGSGFASSVTLTPSLGSVGTTTIYLRLKSGLLQGNFNNEIVNITSQNAAPKTLTLSGTVSCSTSFPLFENFNYSLSSILTSNCWTAHSTGINPITVSANSISYPGYLSSGIGNEVSLNTSGEDINKTITAQTTGTIYTSFLVNVSSATLTGDYFLHLGQTIISTSFRGRVFVKKDASNKLAFGVSQSTTSANYSAFSYDLNTTYLIVLKYNLVNGVSNDIASIYINPTLNAVEPSSGWTLNTDAIGTDLTELGSIALRQGGSSTAPALKISGIRVSNNWEDIVGALLTEPTNHATTFVATTNTATSITNTWNDNDGLQAATAYLILANTTGVFTNPVDGVFEADDIDLSDGSGRINVNHGLQAYEWTGLTAGTQYYFKIYPYNGTGAAVNYKIDGTVPQSNATTLSLNKTLNLTLLLEGLFNGVDGMTPAQGDAGNQFSATIADQITVELYDPSNLTLPVETHNPVDLNINGTCSVNLSSSVLNSNYYIVIKHRNSIETWSANPLSFSGSNINYNFTTGANQAYGNNLNSINGVYVIYGGDVFNDGYIDIFDMIEVENAANNFQEGYIITDITGDSYVDIFDMIIVENNANNFVEVKRP